MYFNYFIHNFSEGNHRISRSCFQYLLILNGEGLLHVPDLGDYPLIPHSMLELPLGSPAELEVDNDREITFGCMELHDFYIFQSAVQQIPSSQTELLRKLFFFALDLQGLTIPRKAAIHNALDHLVFEAITSTGIIVSDMNPAIYHFIDEVTQNYKNPDYDYTAGILKSGYSMNHFRKLFKDTTGNTPLAFCQILRIDYAKGLMRRYGHDMSIKEISERAGFRDSYYFSRLFRKYEKISPSEYMNSHERDD